jgi:hypothetical protein
MKRIVPLLLAFAALPAAAQLREVTIELVPTGCASCTESLPARMARVRGVEHSEVREEPARVVIRLEANNRVRLTRLLDVVQQDGTGVAAVDLDAVGDVFDEQGWRFRILPGDQSLEVNGATPAKAEKLRVKGRIVPPFRAIEVHAMEPQS